MVCAYQHCPPPQLVLCAHTHGSDCALCICRWDLQQPGLTWERLQENKKQELARLNGVYLKLLDGAGVRYLEGRGTIVDPHTVEVAGKRYTVSQGCPMSPNQSDVWPSSALDFAGKQSAADSRLFWAQGGSQSCAWARPLPGRGRGGSGLCSCLEEPMTCNSLTLGSLLRKASIAVVGRNVLLWLQAGYIIAQVTDWCRPTLAPTAYTTCRSIHCRGSIMLMETCFLRHAASTSSGPVHSCPLQTKLF